MTTINKGLTALTSEQRELLQRLLGQQGVDVSGMLIPRLREGNVAPLSSTQRRLWLSGEFAPQTPYGNVPAAFRIEGPLRVDLIARGLNEIVRRHEVLRSTFPRVNGEPVQHIAAKVVIPVTVVDLRELSEHQRVEVALARVCDDARRVFDLAGHPLLRAMALRLDEAVWVLSLVTHHLVTDGWGVRLLLRELACLYAAGLAGTPPLLPELPIQFADYALWELEQLEKSTLGKQVAYWKERLQGAPLELALPTDRPRRTTTSFRSLVHRFVLDAGLSDRLRAFSRSQGVTLYTTLFASFQTILQRYAQHQDIVVGTILSNRSSSETEALIGNFGNNFLIRTQFEGNPTFHEIVVRVRDLLTEAYAHPDLPLEKLIEAVRQEGDVTPIPRFQVMFILRDSTLEQNLKLPGLLIKTIPIDVGTSPLDLILDITDGTPELSGYFEYRIDLFSAKTIERMTVQFCELLERIMTNPDARLAELPLFTGSRQLLQSWECRSVDAFVAPRTPMEVVIAELWRQVLGVDTVGLHDTFYDLGGHSLLAMTVIEQIKQRTGVRVNPIEFGFQTLGQLGALCEQRARPVGTSQSKTLARRLLALIRTAAQRS